MKQLSAFLLLALFAAALAVPAHAQQPETASQQTRAYRKAAKKAQKDTQRYSKQQRKAMKKSAKAQRKALKKAQQQRGWTNNAGRR